jgi:7-keto-8-aminopelargonate synthetase-like enzyme
VLKLAKTTAKVAVEVRSVMSIFGVGLHSRRLIVGVEDPTSALESPLYYLWGVNILTLGFGWRVFEVRIR